MDTRPGEYKKTKKSRKEGASINLEKCVECGVCLRSSNCPTDAIYKQPLEYPWTVRSLMSDVLTVAEESKISGRGSEEMNTNEVTGLFPLGISGIAIEVGRPVAGARIIDVQTLAMAVAVLRVEFEPINPVTSMMSDFKTGKFR